MNKKLSTADKFEIKTLFDRNTSVKEIASLFNVSNTTVRSVVKKLGGVFPPATVTNRKYKLNEDCFGNFESEESLYFFGLMLGDGNIAKDRPRLKIALKKSDKEILEKFSHFLETDRPIRENKLNFNLTIDSVKLSNIFAENNFEPAKSTMEKLPAFYNRCDVNMRHFWRGLIDADGSLFISKDRTEHLNLISSLEVIKEFESFILHHLDISMTSLQQHIKSKNCFYANYYCRNALRVADFLYRDSTISLQRKFDKYKELMSRENRFITKDANRYISFCNTRRLYKVYINIPKNAFRKSQKVFVGAFKTEEEARAARDEFITFLKDIQDK